MSTLFYGFPHAEATPTDTYPGYLDYQPAGALSSANLPPPLPEIGLIARYIAGIGETVRGGRVTRLLDTSGNGYHAASASAATSPLKAFDAGGKPVLRFQTTSSTPMFAGSSRLLSTRRVSAFVVARVPDHGTANQTLFGLNTATGGDLMKFVRDSANLMSLRCANQQTTPASVARSNPTLWGSIAGITPAAHSRTVADAQLGASATNVSLSSALGWSIGAWSTFGGACTADIYEVMVYDTHNVDPAAIWRYAQAKYRLRSNYRHAMHFEGDSISIGSGTAITLSYPFQLWRPELDHWRFSNTAESGSQVSTLTTRVADADAFVAAASGLDRKVMMVLIGRNDCATGVGSGATCYTNLVTYVTDRVAAGWEVWVGTVIGTTTGSVMTEINDLNARIRGTTGSGIIVDAGASRVVDFATIPQLADATAAASTIYYQDGTHPTPAGYKLMADYLANEMAGI